MQRHLEGAGCALIAISFTMPVAEQAPLCPSGNIAVIRISKITPAGSMAGFRKALADHAKWYADHGYGEDVISAAPILLFDAATNGVSKSPDTIMTFHTHAHDVPMDKHDKAWDAYVAEYRANSNIQTETMVCMEK